MLAYDVQSYPLNNNEWSFPLMEIIHIGAFTLSIGTIALVDLRMLGLAMMRRPAAQLYKDTWMWTLVGLIIMLTTGPLIFFSDPFMYLHNASFMFKMYALAIAIIYNYTIHRKVAMSDSSGALASVTAVISLALWVSVVWGGIFIAFV